jgi:hypothetical protein
MSARIRTDYDRKVVASLPAPTPEVARRLAVLLLPRVPSKARAS